MKFTLEKGFVYKLFMLIAFTIFALVMYQGYLKGEFVYQALFYIALGLCAFQIASAIYVLFVKREIEIQIDESSLIWSVYDNKKLIKQQTIKLEDIVDVKTEIAYLLGNIYSNYAITLTLKDESQKRLSDGLFYDFGLKKAEELTRFLLENNLGETQDLKITNIVKDMHIDLQKEQKFTKKVGNSYYIGIVSKNKREFLSLRLQIEAFYKDYAIVEINTNNAYKVKKDKSDDSYIYLKSNVFGIFIEFYKINKIENIKMLKESGRQKISLF